MSSPKRCLSGLFFLSTAVALGLPLVAGCGLFDGLFGNPNAVARIQINTDPGDPMIARLTGIKSPDVLVFFGDKDANGKAIRATSMQYFAPGSTDPYFFQLDEQQRPIFITGPNGETATLTYSGNAVSVTFKDSAGNVSVESFQIPNEAAKSIRANAEILAQRAKRAPKQITAARTDTTVVSVRGFLKVNAKASGVDAGTVRDAKVVVTSPTADGIIPVGFNAGNGFYEFSIPHRVADLQVLIGECQSVTGDTSAAFTGAGVVLAALAAACIGVTGGFCGFILGPGGAIIGLGVAGTGGTATAANYLCDDLIINQAVKSGAGVQSVNIAVSHPTLGSTSGTVQYDLFNPNDPVGAAKAFQTALTLNTSAAITNVTTNPTAPAARQSYRVVFNFVPPGASIRYTISGTDNFATSETLAGDGVSGTVTGKTIPGGAKGVRDTIVADILINGQKVGNSTNISITFF